MDGERNFICELSVHRSTHLSRTGAEPEDPAAAELVQSNGLVETALVHTDRRTVTWRRKDTHVFVLCVCLSVYVCVPPCVRYL